MCHTKRRLNIVGINKLAIHFILQGKKQKNSVMKEIYRGKVKFLKKTTLKIRKKHKVLDSKIIKNLKNAK